MLRLTLPSAVRFGNVTIVTSPEDADAQELAEEYGCRCHTTDAWYEGGSAFNKAAAINSALAAESPKWVLLLDADVLLTCPPGGRFPLEKLDCHALYGARRFACRTPNDWLRCVRHGSWYRLPMMPLPPLHKGPRGMRYLWGNPKYGSVRNNYAVQGYFQLWYYPNRAAPLHTGSGTAGKYDVWLAMDFSDSKRAILHWRQGCIHLGTPRANWKGRVTGRWDDMPQVSLQKLDAATQMYRAITR